MSAARALADARRFGLRMRVDEAGRLKVAGDRAKVPPDLQARLREHKPELVALLAGRACRRCGGAIVDRGPDAWAPFADGTAAHMTCEDAWEVERLRARAGNALSPEALADEAEVTARGAAP